MKIQGKLLTGYLLGGLLTGLVGFCGWYVTKTINREFVQVSEKSFPANQAIDEVRFTAVRIISSTTEYALLVEEGRSMPGRVNKAAEEDEELVWQVDCKLFKDAIRDYEKLERTDPEGKEILAKVLQQGEALLNTSALFVREVKRGGNGTNLLALKEPFEDQEMQFLQTIDSALEKEKANVTASQQKVRNALAAAARANVVVTILALILAMVSGHVISAAIGGSINRLKFAAEKIGRGELDTIIVVESRDEVGALAQTFNQMTVALKHSRDELVAAKESAEHSAAELQQSNDDLRNFNYIFFHDLREPMVNLKGFATELQATLQDASDMVGASVDRLDERISQRLTRALQQEAPEALNFINASVQQMNHLFNAILALSLLTRRKLKPEALDIAELVQSVAATHVKQSAKLTIGPLPPLVADRTFLKMVIGHLLDNAMKYLEPGRPGEIEVSGEPGNGSITIHIRDNGRGIAQEDLSKIFDIFRRAGKQDVPGEGMGLPYSKAMVRRHGGRIWCESVPGVGSTFSFSLPNQPVNDEASP